MAEEPNENELEGTAELGFKYNESKIELDLLKTQYAALAEAYSNLEQDCAAKHSQIESLKLAVHYTSSYEISKEADYKTRIKELESTVKSLREDKEILSSKYIRQMNLKEAYIESLTTTLLNLHQKIEYSKEDFTTLKNHYESQKQTLENEMKLREDTELLYSQSLAEIESFRASLKEMTHEYTETLINTEQMVKDLQTNYELEHEEEIAKLARKYDHKLKSVKDYYDAKTSNLEKGQKEITESMMKYMSGRLENMKNHYEIRIAAMIREYGFTEAKYQSRISNLSSLITTLQHNYTVIEGELLGKSSCINLISKERKELIMQKQNLDKYIEKLEIDHKRIAASNYFEFEEMKKSMERGQQELKEQYEKKLLMISNRKSLSIEGIKLRYHRNLEKFKKASLEDAEKSKKFHELQCEFLLDSLAKLEAEKTELEIKLECDVRELKTDLELKVSAYERKLNISREEIWKEYNKEREDSLTEYKIRLHEQGKQLLAEKEKAVLEVERNYKEILKNLKAEFDKEKLEMFADNLKKMGEVQDLCKKRVDFVELQLSTIKQNFSNEFDLWEKSAKSKDKEIKSLSAEVAELSTKLSLAYSRVDQLAADKKELHNELHRTLENKNKSFAEREAELCIWFENEKKTLTAKANAEKAEAEAKLEKSFRLVTERYDSLMLKYKALESKKRDIFLKENQHTLQRLMAEINDRNKTIDELHKELAKLKVQIKYTGETMKIFTTEKIITATHRKIVSDLGPSSRTRPSSVSGNRSFKFN